MPQFLITKKITSHLVVNCDDKEEALAWTDKIVAGLEDQDGNPIPADSVIDFVAEYAPDEVKIELLEDDLD